MNHLNPDQQRWFRPTRQDVWMLALVVVAYASAYASTMISKPQFAPDSRYYAGMALRFTGNSQAEAAQQVAAHSALFGWESPAVEILFGWGLVQPRVVYPALSAPFVKLFGIEGLTVVPAIATFLFLVLMAVIVARRWSRTVAVATVLLVCTSPMLFFYFTSMLTESLTALWCVLLLLVVWRHQRTPSWGWIWAMVLLTVIFAFTRQSTLIPAGAFVSAWFCALVLRQDHRRWRAAALAVGATAIGVQMLQSMLFPSFSQLEQFMDQTEADSWGEALLESPELAWHILTTDATFLAAGDRSLLLLLVLALLSMVIFWRRSESHMLLGSLAAYEIYNITNGTPTAFRYGSPGLIFVVLSAALLINTVRTSMANDPGSAVEAEPAASTTVSAPPSA